MATSYPHCAGCGESRGAWYESQVPGFLCASCLHQADWDDPDMGGHTRGENLAWARLYGEFLYTHCAWCGDYMFANQEPSRRYVHDACKAGYRVEKARPRPPLDLCLTCFQVRTRTGACACTD